MSAITWQDLLDECSRLHTVRRCECFLCDGVGCVYCNQRGTREDAQVRRVVVRPAEAERPSYALRVVPTRMSEPGFYMDFDHYTERSATEYEHAKIRYFVNLFEQDVRAGRAIWEPAP